MNSTLLSQKKADTSQPRIISEVGNNPTAMHELEPPPDHKGVVTAITIVFAFIFAVAGVFIGMELNELNGLLSGQFFITDNGAMIYIP